MVAGLRATVRRVPGLVKAHHLIGLHRRMSGPGPVAVYSMGKVGSAAVAETIEAEIGRPVLHCHRVTGVGISAARSWEREHGAPPSPHSWNGEYLRYRLAFERRRRWDIVCGVREPIGRDIAAVFQNAERFGWFDPAFPDGGIDPTDVVGQVVRWGRQDHLGTVGWFDAELRAVTGIDVLAVPFDRSAGFGVYERGRFRVLLFRFEDLDRVGSEAIGSFFAVPGPPMHEVNIGARKPYADAYRRFTAGAVFPESALDAAYESRLARHFYSDEERARFRARWSRPAAIT